MRKLILALLILAPAAAEAAPPRGFDARVEAVRRQVGAPGVAVAIVENGKVTLARGYGAKTLSGGDRVDSDTLFQIGSVTKGFTTAALATLVDEGKLGWDDKVIDHLPSFRMYDPWVTREMTVRDLLVHRSGLGPGQGDLMLVPATNLSRAETVRRLRFLKPATSFRSAYAYDNVLYIVAGELIEAVTGQPWEIYVRDRLFQPAGMANSVTNDLDRFAAANRALPHGRTAGELRGMGPQAALDEKAVAISPNAGPAGSIASTAEDMGRWLAVQLAAGQAPGGARVFSAASGAEMWKPVVPVPIITFSGALPPATPSFRNYGLGWTIQDYRGHRIVQHGGATLGFRATMMMIPEKNVGFVVMTNSEETALIQGLQYELADHYLGLPRRDWAAAFGGWLDKRNAEAVAAVQAASRVRPPASKPSLAPSGYAGRYEDPWYGPIAVRQDGDGLVVDFLQSPGMTGRLEHWAYDTFVARWRDPTTEPAFVTFSLSPDGKPERVTMKAVSPVADFSYDYQDLLFTPVASGR
ncbi:serine hydrolase [Phenylobacterium sp.]|uniref:serine hydrolase n=1 Tax=Phenylobacterium sp. TaxID=1871053 RepID=UPI0035B33EA0